MIPIWIAIIIAVVMFNLGFLTHGLFTIGKDMPQPEPKQPLNELSEFAEVVDAEIKRRASIPPHDVEKYYQEGKGDD